MNPLRRLATVIGLCACTVTGCGRYPAHIQSRRDIGFTSRAETHITITGLGSEDIRALSRLRELHEIQFKAGATDQQMIALAELRLPKLAQVVLTDCPQVTDMGVMALSQLPALRGLGLRGTGVGDTGCLWIARRMRLEGINLPRCPKVTAAGLLALARSPTIERLGFSLSDLTQADLLQIIRATRRVTHIEIEITGNADRKLNLPRLRSSASTEGITLLRVDDLDVSEL
jgi:hypothetical protein